MLRYTTDRARPDLVALYDIGPGNGMGQFLQPWSPHGTAGAIRRAPRAGSGVVRIDPPRFLAGYRTR